MLLVTALFFKFLRRKGAAPLQQPFKQVWMYFFASKSRFSKEFACAAHASRCRWQLWESQNESYILLIPVLKKIKKSLRSGSLIPPKKGCNRNGMQHKALFKNLCTLHVFHYLISLHHLMIYLDPIGIEIAQKF